MSDRRKNKSIMLSRHKSYRHASLKKEHTVIVKNKKNKTIVRKEIRRKKRTAIVKNARNTNTSSNSNNFSLYS